MEQSESWTDARVSLLLTWFCGHVAYELFYRADIAGYVPPAGESIENPDRLK